jgi:hypothetical protein
MQKAELGCRHKIGLILLLAAVAGCAGQPASSPGGGCSLPEGVDTVAADFRALRPVRGQFDGGSWQAEVDSWQGRKHQAMIQLGDLLGSGSCLSQQVQELLGPPDATVQAGDALFDQVSNLPGFKRPASEAYQLMIYDWRGTHDFLYFTVQGNTILGSGWWYAGE